MGDEEQLKKLREASAKIKQLGDQAVRAQEEENRRLKELVDAQIRAGQQQLARKLKDVEDPLNLPVGRVSDIEFLEGGIPDPKTIQRMIFQWRDTDGNEFYTRDYNLDLQKARALRDKVVAQQKVWGGLASEDQSRIQNEWQFSAGKAPNALPFQEFLTSSALGERFTQLKQNLPRPTFGR